MEFKDVLKEDLIRKFRDICRRWDRITNEQINEFISECSVAFFSDRETKLIIIEALGISESSYKGLLKKESSDAWIKLKLTEEIIDEIRKDIPEEIWEQDGITKEELFSLATRLGTTPNVLKRIFNISDTIYSNLINGKITKAAIKVNVDEHIIEEIRDRKERQGRISKEEVLELCREFNITPRVVKTALGIRENGFSELMSGSIEFVGFKIRDCVYEKLKKEVQQKVKGRFKITLQEILQIVEEVNSSVWTVRKILGIHHDKISSLNTGNTQFVYIIDADMLRKVQNIIAKLMITPGCGERYYSREELSKIAEENGIQLDDILEYMDGKKERYYEQNKYILDNNPKGIWIGSEIPISNEFMENYGRELQEVVEDAIHSYCVKSGRRQCERERVHDIFTEIWKTCGKLQRNLSEFDIQGFYKIIIRKSIHLIHVLERQNNYDSSLIHYDINGETVNLLDDYPTAVFYPGESSFYDEYFYDEHISSGDFYEQCFSDADFFANHQYERSASYDANGNKRIRNPESGMYEVVYDSACFTSDGGETVRKMYDRTENDF